MGNVGWNPSTKADQHQIHHGEFDVDLNEQADSGDGINSETLFRTKVRVINHSKLPSQGSQMKVQS